MNQNTAMISNFLRSSSPETIMFDAIEIMCNDKQYEFNDAAAAYEDLMGATEVHAVWFMCVHRMTFGSMHDAPPAVKYMAQKVFMSRDPSKQLWLLNIQRRAMTMRRY